MAIEKAFQRSSSEEIHTQIHITTAGPDLTELFVIALFMADESCIFIVPSRSRGRFRLTVGLSLRLNVCRLINSESSGSAGGVNLSKWIKVHQPFIKL